MQIVIPMSGFGERFKKAGYTIPKPLIEINDKPIIQHVVEMFPGETNFIFICNKEHLYLTKYRMKEILKKTYITRITHDDFLKRVEIEDRIEYTKKEIQTKKQKNLGKKRPKHYLQKKKVRIEKPQSHSVTEV